MANSLNGLSPSPHAQSTDEAPNAISDEQHAFSAPGLTPFNTWGTEVSMSDDVEDLRDSIHYLPEAPERGSGDNDPLRFYARRNY